MWHYSVKMPAAYFASILLMLQICTDHTAFPDFLTSAAEGKMMKIVEMYNSMLISCFDGLWSLRYTRKYTST